MARCRVTLWPPRARVVPGKRFRVLWDIIQSIFLVYIAIVAPIKVGFGIKTPPWSFGHVLDIVMDIYFLFDLLVTFRSAYYHPKTGQLVTSARAIACTYAQGWLAIDVVSSVPLALIEGIVDFDKIVDNRVQVDDKEQSSLRLVRILMHGCLTLGAVVLGGEWCA